MKFNCNPNHPADTKVLDVPVLATALADLLPAPSPATPRGPFLPRGSRLPESMASAAPSLLAESTWKQADAPTISESFSNATKKFAQGPSLLLSTVVNTLA